MRTMIVMLAAGVALAGCGGSKAKDAHDAEGDGTMAVAAKGSDPDPCSLLSAAEMAAITTDAVTNVKRQEGARCIYASAQADTDVTVHATGGAAQMATAHRVAGLLGGMGSAVANKSGAGADTAGLLKSDGKAVPAIGEEALWEPNATLAVRRGDAFVEVTPPIMHDPATHSGYPIVPDAEKRDIARKLAMALLAKLPR